MSKAPGQRWLWTNSGFEHIVEVLPDGSSMTIQILTTNRNIDLYVGQIRNLSLGSDYTRWQYLEGQDKPRE